MSAQEDVSNEEPSDDRFRGDVSTPSITHRADAEARFNVQFTEGQVVEDVISTDFVSNLKKTKTIHALTSARTAVHRVLA